MSGPRKPASPFRYFTTLPEVIRMVVLMYVRFPPGLRKVEDLLAERIDRCHEIDVCHKTVRHWWNRFGPMLAADIKMQRISRMNGYTQWRWLNGKLSWVKKRLGEGEHCQVETSSCQTFRSDLWVIVDWAEFAPGWQHSNFKPPDRDGWFAHNFVRRPNKSCTILV